MPSGLARPLLGKRVRSPPPCSPLWGGVGGGGRAMRHLRCTRTTPLPSPPPQGGREQTEFAVRMSINTTGSKGSVTHAHEQIFGNPRGSGAGHRRGERSIGTDGREVRARLEVRGAGGALFRCDRQGLLQGGRPQ